MTPANLMRSGFTLSFIHLIPYLPHGLQCALAEAIAWQMKNSRQARITQEELARYLGQVFSARQLQDLARQGMANHKKDLFEIWSFPRLTPKKLFKLASLKGKAHLDQALSKGQGAVIAVSHFGSWKMIIAALSYYGYPVNQIGLNPREFISKHRPAHHNRIMEQEYRADQSLPANFIYLGGGLKAVFQALRRGELVLNSCDGFKGKKFIELPFAKATNRLSLGPFSLAYKSKAPLLPVFDIRGKDNKHQITIHPPLEMDYTLGPGKGPQAAAKKYAKLFEKHFLEHPDHYCRTLYDRRMDPQR